MTPSYAPVPWEREWRKRARTLNSGKLLLGGSVTVCSLSEVLRGIGRSSLGSGPHEAVYGPVSSHDAIAHVAV